jgi:hypothetical protein
MSYLAGAVAPFMAGAILGASSPTVVFALSGTITRSKINISKKITGFLVSFYFSHFHLMFCTSNVGWGQCILQWLHHKRCYETALYLAIYFVTRALFEDSSKAGKERHIFSY